MPRHPRPVQEKAWLPLAVSVLLGAATGLAVLLVGRAGMCFVAGWTVAATVWSAWTWLVVRRMDGHETEAHASSEDPGRGFSDAFLTLAAFASLVGVGVLLVAGSNKDATGYLYGALGTAAVAASWVTVHMLFTLRYAREFYGDGGHGIDFAHTEQPDYQDFAYLSYCLGMTYQVSDQTITTSSIRHTVMRHCLLSYVLGAVVLASTINLVVQLASSGG